MTSEEFDKVKKIFFSLPGETQEGILEAYKAMSQAYIEDMLDEEVFSFSGTPTTEHLTKVLNSFKEHFSNRVPEQLRIDEDFIKLDKYAIEKGNRTSAILLITTSIEHILNMFYSDVFTRRGLSNKEINDMMWIKVESKTG